MKTFEEKFTAWVDGRLTGSELAAFERELEEHPEALAEKEAALELGGLLRAHLAAPPLRNADFFNQQILQQIESSVRPAAPAPAPRRSFWTLPRMAFSGAFLLLLASLLYFAAVPNTRREVRRDQQYVTNVLNAQSDDPNITATSFHSDQDNVNVVWLDGLSYMPPDHKLK
jgi:anti-sigma factor RsiW